MSRDTSIGGHADRFPETRVSLIVTAHRGDAEERGRALDAVIAGYWKPVYKYIRVRWKAPNEDAKDLTQGFFARVLESPFFERFDPTRARFRTYLRMTLDRFVSNELKSTGRQKRGGGIEHVSLDVDALDGDLQRLDSRLDPDPDALFRDEWIRSLFARGIEDLRDWCIEKDKLQHFEIFEAYDLDPSETRPSYAELADRMGLPVTQVTNFLALSRRTFRRLLLERIRELSGSEQEFREDVRDILGELPE